MTNEELKEYMDTLNDKMDDMKIEVVKLNTVKGILFAVASIILPFMLFFYTMIENNTTMIHKLDKQYIKIETKIEHSK